MVIERTSGSVAEITAKINGMATSLNKIAYLESILRQSADFDTKRFIWGKLGEFYEERKMYEKAAKAMATKAGIDFSVKDKTESYLRAAELYATVGKIEDADNMFGLALRDAGTDRKEMIKLAMKNIYRKNADNLDKSGKKATALKFYIRLIKSGIDDAEKKEIKARVIQIYNALGKFREAKLIEGI